MDKGYCIRLLIQAASRARGPRRLWLLGILARMGVGYGR